MFGKDAIEKFKAAAQEIISVNRELVRELRVLNESLKEVAAELKKRKP